MPSAARRAFTAGLLAGFTLVGLVVAAGRRMLRRRAEQRRPSSLVEEGRVVIDGARPPSEAELDARPLEESPREPLASEAEWDVTPERERW
jgi:hypothetical protein